MGGIRDAGAVNRNRKCMRDVGPKGNRELCNGQAYARLVNTLGQPDVCKDCFRALQTDVDPCVRAWTVGALVYSPELPPAA